MAQTTATSETTEDSTCGSAWAIIWRRVSVSLVKWLMTSPWLCVSK